MIDLKKYANKEALVQFKPGHGLLSVFAAPNGSLQLLGVLNTKSNEREPVMLPFVKGFVTEDGDGVVVLDAESGGKVLVVVDESTIAFVNVMVTPSKAPEPKPQPEGPPLILVPGNIGKIG